jgi:hypothetical protein
LRAVAIVILHIINVIKCTVRKDGFVCLHCDGHAFQNSVTAVTEHRYSNKLSFGPISSNIKQTGL